MRRTIERGRDPSRSSLRAAGARPLLFPTDRVVVNILGTYGLTEDLNAPGEALTALFKPVAAAPMRPIDAPAGAIDKTAISRDPSLESEAVRFEPPVGDPRCIRSAHGGHREATRSGNKREEAQCHYYETGSDHLRTKRSAFGEYEETLQARVVAD